MKIEQEENQPKISIAKIKSMNNPDEIKKYLIENRSNILLQIALGGKNGLEKVKLLNSLFSFVFKYLNYEEIFRYLESLFLGVYIDNELDDSFEIGFHTDICNLILNYHHTEVAKRYLDDQIYYLFPYFLEIKDRDEEVCDVLLRIKKAWLPYCRMLDKDDRKALKRIFGTDFSDEWY